jgi:pilus assembly protein CpaE
MLSSNGDITDKLAGFEAGIDEYLAKPFQPLELVHRLRILLAHQGKRPQLEASAPRRGKTIALFGTKGGVGRTTIGVNLAVALQRQTQTSPVVLFDADFFFGDTALHLNLPPARTIIDLVPRIGQLDADVLEQVLVPHSSGIRVLLSPRNPEDVESISPDHLSSLLDRIVSCYDYVVVDCQATYDERTLVLLEKADAILLVIKPEVGCVKNMAVFSEIAIKLGLSFEKKIHIVLNRAGSKTGIGTGEIERIFRRQIAFQIPSAGNAVVMSVNRGIPLLIEHPNHPFSVQITRMADYLIRGLAATSESSRMLGIVPERSLS